MIISWIAIFLLDLHSINMEGLLPRNEVGSVRQHSMVISGTDYQPPVGTEYLDSELRYLLETPESIENIVDRAVYLHLNLCYLHYFYDGNKRTARMVQTACLFKGDLIPLFFTDKDVNGYRKAIVSYYETGDVSLYVSWFIKEYEMMMQRLLPKPPRTSRTFNS